MNRSIDMHAPLNARMAALSSQLGMLSERLDLAQRELEVIQRQRDLEEKRAAVLERNLDRVIEAVNKLCTLSVAAIDGGRAKIAALPAKRRKS